MKHWVPARPLDEVSFAPFGSVIRTDPDRPEALPKVVARLPDHRAARAPREVTIESHAPHLGASLEVARLERDPSAARMWVPLWGATKPRALLVVALGAKEVDVATLAAFVLDGAMAVSINPGVWHLPPIALDAQIDFLGVGTAGRPNELEIATLPSTNIAVAIGAAAELAARPRPDQIRFELDLASAQLGTRRGFAVELLRAHEEQLGRALIDAGRGTLVDAVSARAMRAARPQALEALEAFRRAEAWQWEIGTWASAGAEGLGSMMEVHRLRLAQAWLLIACGDQQSALGLVEQVESDPNGLHEQLLSELTALRRRLAEA